MRYKQEIDKHIDSLQILVDNLKVGLESKTLTNDQALNLAGNIEHKLNQVINIVELETDEG